MGRVGRRLMVMILALGPWTGTAAAEPATDSTTGLKMAPGWELVRAHCGGCHSWTLVTSQRGNRQFWLNTIRWMQKKQNLWQIPEDQEAQLLDYLASQYAPRSWGRRPPLPAGLMPPPKQPGLTDLH